MGVCDAFVGFVNESGFGSQVLQIHKNIDKIYSFMQGGKIQSVLINREKNTLSSAKAWITKHGFKINTKPANFRTQHYYRFRQIEPKALAKEGYTKYRMKMIDAHHGIMLVLAYK